MPPPDRFVFDLDQPYPDVIVETIRQRVVAVLADLDTKSAQLGGALLLVDTALCFAQTVLETVPPLQQQVAEQAGQIADLQAALEALTPTTPTGGAA